MINIIHLGEWPKDTPSDPVVMGWPGIAVVEESARQASDMGIGIRRALRGCEGIDCNLFLIVNSPGEEFEDSYQILQAQCPDLRIILIDLSDDERNRLKAAGSLDREVLPGIDLAERLMPAGHTVRVLGVSCISKENLAPVLNSEFSSEFEVLHLATLPKEFTPCLERVH